MPTEDYGAWFQFDLARFLATPATGSKHIFFSILPTQREYNMLYHVLFICNSSMWTFLGRFWLIIVNLLGISTRLQIKFRGNCRADLMVSFRVGASRKQHRLDCYHFVCPAIVLHHLQWILPQILKTKKEKKENLEIFPGGKKNWGFKKVQHDNVRIDMEAWRAMWEYDMCLNGQQLDRFKFENVTLQLSYYRFITCHGGGKC